jgi:hypothetical protein
MAMCSASPPSDEFAELAAAAAEAAAAPPREKRCWQSAWVVRDVKCEAEEVRLS